MSHCPGFSAVPQSTNALLVKLEKGVRAGPGSLTPDLQSCQLENSEECVYGALRDQNETTLFLSLAAAFYLSLFDGELYFQKRLVLYQDFSVWVGGRHNEPTHMTLVLPLEACVW